MNKRTLDIVVISDIHLGTYECHAKELLQYLRSIQAGVLILNGAFIDAAYLRKNNLPKEHALIIQEIIYMAIAGTQVYCLTDNMNGMQRKISEFSMDKISLRNKLVLQLKHKKYWFFPGAELERYSSDASLMQYFIRKGNGVLLRSNRWVNNWRQRMGKPRSGHVKKIKLGVKNALQVIQDFEKKVIQLAAEQGYDYVICGYSHQPVIRETEGSQNPITYMNAGDWVENLTALEYVRGHWKLYEYDELDYDYINPRLVVKTKPKKEVQSPPRARTDRVIPFEEFIKTPQNGTPDAR